MTATLFDVCRRSGVSTATVSRVINGSPLVQERTRRRVQKAVRELGYRPSHAARTLARQRTDTIGVIFPEIDSGFFTEVLRGVDEVAAEHRLHLMTAFSHGASDEQALVMRFLDERRVDALILMNLLLPNTFIREAARGGLPIVLIDRPVSGTNLFAVSLDNQGGASLAMSHLLKHGHRRLAVITGPDKNYDSDQRLKGCRKALAAVGRKLPASAIWRGDFTEASGFGVVTKRLKAGRARPEAIFAFNDAMAAGAMRALRNAGVRVPDDVAVVGFDDAPWSQHIGLTTVRAPMREMGRAAAAAAVRLVTNGKSSRRQVLAVELVVRQSCGSDTHP